MSRLTRMATLLGSGLALSAALLATTTTAASAAQAHPAATRTASAAAVATPASETCGFNSGGLFGQAQYWNCSPYSVQIRVEWWFASDTYLCVGPHISTALNTNGDTTPRYADFTGRTHC